MKRISIAIFCLSYPLFGWADVNSKDQLVDCPRNDDGLRNESKSVNLSKNERIFEELTGKPHYLWFTDDALKFYNSNRKFYDSNKIELEDDKAKDTLTVYPKIVVTQEKRSSKIGADAKVLYEIYKEFTGSDAADEPDLIPCLAITQKYQREDITVEIKNSDGSKSVYTKKIKSGPEENFYLSADLPVKDVNEIVFDEDSSTFKEVGKPSKFYMSLNYKFGDVYKNYDEGKIYKNMSAKVLVKVSSRPLESYGVGLGYSHNGVNIFVARIRTKSSEFDGESADSTVVGLGFDLSKGLSWLK